MEVDVERVTGATGLDGWFVYALHLCFSPFFLSSSIFDEQMTHHHSWPSPFSFPSLGQVAWFVASAVFDLGASFAFEFFVFYFTLGVVSFLAGAQWSWAGFRLFCPNFSHTVPSPGLLVLSCVFFFFLSFWWFEFPRLISHLDAISFVYVLYHHRYPKASYGFGEKKSTSGTGSHSSFVDTQPSTRKMNKNREGVEELYWMVESI